MTCQDHLYRHADPQHLSRRWFLEQCGVGLGSIALGQLLQEEGYATAPGKSTGINPLAPKRLIMRPRPSE